MKELSHSNKVSVYPSFSKPAFVSLLRTSTSYQFIPFPLITAPRTWLRSIFLASIMLSSRSGLASSTSTLPKSVPAAVDLVSRLPLSPLPGRSSFRQRA